MDHGDLQPEVTAGERHGHRPVGDDAVSGIPSFVYVSYIHATPEQVWAALTDPEITARYWWHRNVSDWHVGSRWEHLATTDGAVHNAGQVLESVRPKRLAYTWQNWFHPDTPDSTVSFDIEEAAGAVKLTVTHADLPNTEARGDFAEGWSAVVSSLKSLLETGKPIDLSSFLPEDR
ncbi:hypothetical protein D5S17_10310 [Pseudonocardiaceae bacterium YIM PH 21723]|nr:hypothetical protein D5S17_10310 [Pseudonocardiaceae bacterium YIM PH 21723]